MNDEDVTFGTAYAQVKDGTAVSVSRTPQGSIWISFGDYQRISIWGEPNDVGRAMHKALAQLEAVLMTKEDVA